MREIGNAFVRTTEAALVATGISLALIGCGMTSAGPADKAPAQGSAAEASSATTNEASTVSDAKSNATTGQTDAVTTTANLTTDGAIDTEKLFSDRDLRQEADTSGATKLTLSDGKDTVIEEEGVYIVSGEAKNARIVVNAEDTAKVQIVLDGVSITNESTPAIYVKSADKVWVTTAKDTTNSLTVTGAFQADGDVNCDAAIFSRDDLVLNGLGTLKVSSTDNGITSKDDLRVTGGSYEIDVASDALEANDSIAICDGSFTITSKKDGLHAENDDDDSLGYIYLCGGSYTIKADSDAIQATTHLQIDDGSFAIESGEGLEATYVQINGGTIAIKATDDGINASAKSTSIDTPAIEIRGGELTIDMGQGDTDALDANGNLLISGGTVTINAQFAFDFDGEGALSGGTVTVNGEQVSEITNSMQMGGGGPMGGHGGGGRGQMGGAPRDMG